MRPAGFVHDLCIALAHKWDPERLFVILTAYFDESGTHGDAPATVVGSLMGSATQWARFEAGISVLRKKHGFGVIHSKDFKKMRGADATRGRLIVADFTELADRTIMEGAVFPVDMVEYKRDYIAARPRKPRLDSAYGLGFRVCLAHLIKEAERRCKSKKSHTLHAVVESGARNIPDASRIFAETRERMKAGGSHIQLGTFTEADKAACAPLMGADIVAHSTYIRIVAASKGTPFALGKYSGNKPSVTHLSIPGGLAKLRSLAIEDHERRVAWGAKRS